MDNYQRDFYRTIGREFLQFLYPVKMLWIDGVEVTQAIQYYHSREHLTDSADWGANNSVRLISGKPAWVRVYVRRPSFFGAVAGVGHPLGDIAGVTGTLEVYRRFNGAFYSSLGTVNPEPPGTVTARHDPPYAIERGTLGYSLNFIIPANLMCGNLMLTARVSSPGGATDEYVLYVNVTLRQTLRVRGIMIAYDGPANGAPNAPNLTLAAPTLADLQATSAWMLLVYPVQSAATYSSAGSITWDRPLTDAPSCDGCCTTNWDDLLAAAQAQRVADGNLTDVLYYGLLPAGIPRGPVIGCSPLDAGGVSVGPNGRQETMAHELGHACGLSHAPCGGVGTSADPNYPAYEPYDAGGTPQASIGEYGLDISNGTIKSPGTFRDFMSYCGPKWISPYQYGRLVNDSELDPHIVCEDHPWILDQYRQYKPPGPPEPIPVLERRFVVTDPEPIISIIGIVHADEQIEVKSVMRLSAVRQVPKGEQTGLTAELLGPEGKLVVQTPVYRLPSMGDGNCGCGCEAGRQAARYPYVFQAFLSDVEPGAALRIRRGEKEIWRRLAPKGKPRVASLTVEVDKEGELIAQYQVEGAGAEAEYWLQWSNDRGKTWHGLATRLGPEGVRLTSPGLPTGRIQVRLLAGNGFHTVASRSVQVQVPDRPPVISILTPKDGQALLAGQSVRLWGVISTQTGEEWAIDRAFWKVDGKEVGAGLDVFIPAPPQGEHRLTLVAETKGKRAERTISFVTVELPKK